MSRTRLLTGSMLMWPAWVAMNTIGVLSAYLLALLLLPAGELLNLQVSDQTLGIAMFLLIGLSLGLAQWLLVRTHLPHPALWIPATFAGWISPIALLLLFLPPSISDQRAQIGVLLPSIGLLMGTAQYFLLRPHKPHSEWWILASVLGWLALALSLPVPITNQVEILKVGAIPALITGIPFALLVSARTPSGSEARRLHAA